MREGERGRLFGSTVVVVTKSAVVSLAVKAQILSDETLSIRQSMRTR